MAYDEELARRIRELLVGDKDVTEMKMFGGLAYLVGVWGFKSPIAAQPRADVVYDPGSESPTAPPRNR